MWKNPVYDSIYYVKIFIPEQECFKIFISVYRGWGWHAILWCITILTFWSTGSFMSIGIIQQMDSRTWGVSQLWLRLKGKIFCWKESELHKVTNCYGLFTGTECQPCDKIQIYCQHSNLFPQQNSHIALTQQLIQSIQDNITDLLIWQTIHGFAEKKFTELSFAELQDSLGTEPAVICSRDCLSWSLKKLHTCEISIWTCAG